MKKSRQQRRTEALKRRREARRKTQRPQPKPSRLKPILARVHPRHWLRRSFSLAWKIVVAVSVVVGLLAAIVTFWPRIFVSSSSSLNPRTPFATPFIISNEGYAEVTDLSTQMLVRRVTVAEGKGIAIRDNKLYDSRAIPIAAISPGGKYTAIYP